MTVLEEEVVLNLIGLLLGENLDFLLKSNNRINSVECLSLLSLV